MTALDHDTTALSSQEQSLLSTAIDELRDIIRCENDPRLGDDCARLVLEERGCGCHNPDTLAVSYLTFDELRALVAAAERSLDL